MNLFESFTDELEKISGVQRIARLERALDKAQLAHRSAHPERTARFFGIKVRKAAPGSNAEIKKIEEALQAARRKHARRVTGDVDNMPLRLRSQLTPGKTDITPKSPTHFLVPEGTDLSAQLGVPQVGEFLRKRRIDRYYGRADKAFREGGFKQHRRRMDAPRPPWRKERDMKKLTGSKK